MVEGKRVDIDAYLSKSDPEMKKLALGIRHLIFNVKPETDEFIKWNNLLYEVDNPVMAIVIHKSHINLQFVRGRELMELGYPVEGTGKNIRHVKISNPSEIDSSLEDLVMKAFELNQSS